MANFRKLDVWNLSHDLTVSIYTVTDSFPAKELYALTSQMKRASYSIPSNITEGSLRGSQKDFKRFLSIALGSSAELQYFLLLAKDLKYITENTYNQLANRTEVISKKLQVLIRRVKEDIERPIANN